MADQDRLDLAAIVKIEMDEESRQMADAHFRHVKRLVRDLEDPLKNVTDQLEVYEELLRQGAITEEAFQRARERVEDAEERLEREINMREQINEKLREEAELQKQIEQREKNTHRMREEIARDRERRRDEMAGGAGDILNSLGVPGAGRLIQAGIKGGFALPLAATTAAITAAIGITNRHLQQIEANTIQGRGEGVDPIQRERVMQALLRSGMTTAGAETATGRISDFAFRTGMSPSEAARHLFDVTAAGDLRSRSLARQRIMGTREAGLVTERADFDMPVPGEEELGYLRTAGRIARRAAPGFLYEHGLGVGTKAILEALDQIARGLGAPSLDVEARNEKSKNAGRSKPPVDAGDES